MKSLITTVAVSMALSAVATDTGYISGTSFEDIEFDGSSVELIKDANDAGGSSGVRYWTTDAWKTENSADYEGFFVVTNISGDTSYPESRPEHWANAEKNNALVIDTDKPLYRRINPVISMDNSTERTLDTKGVFFDSVVQFTSTDVPLEPGNSDKLLVWLYSSPEDVSQTTPGLFGEDTPMTNLVVTAGYYKEYGGTPYTTNYCVTAEGVSVNPDEWHRLTIKAFMSNGYSLFNVFVDGKKVSVAGEEIDFISLKDKNDGGNIVGVAFDGKGMVDDIAFTTTAPDFANEGGTPVETFALNVALYAATEANASLLDIKTNDVSVTSVNGSYILKMGVDNVKAYVECNSNYKVSNSQATYDSVEKYWIIPIDVTSATADGTLNVTISVEVGAAGGGDDVTYPTVKPNGETTTEVTLSPAAKDVIKAAFTNGSGVYNAPDTLTVIVNGEEYLGDKAVNMINSVAQMFNGNPFDAKGNLEIVFKVTDVRIAEGATGGYTLTVGEATLKDAYEVAPDYIDLASGQSDPNGKPTDGRPVIFKLVVKEKAPTTTP